MPRCYLLEEGWNRARLWRIGDPPDRYRVLPPRRFTGDDDADAWLRTHLPLNDFARTLREIGSHDSTLADGPWRMTDHEVRGYVLRQIARGRVPVLRPLPDAVRLIAIWPVPGEVLPPLDTQCSALLVQAATATPGNDDAIERVLIALAEAGRRAEGDTAAARLAFALGHRWLDVSAAAGFPEAVIAIHPRIDGRSVEMRPAPAIAASTPSGGEKREPEPAAPVNECAKRFQRREAVIAQARATAAQRASEGSLKPDEAAMIHATANRFEQYNKAMPRAKAARNVYDTPKKKEECLTDLSRDAAFLGRYGLTPGDFENKKTGFKAALYKSESDGSLILAAQGTDPNKLVDWETNVYNGLAHETEQYKAISELAVDLKDRGLVFDLAGHSKGGGLASEAGLAVPDARVYTFNSAGLPDAAPSRHGAGNFDSLDSRTMAYQTQGDFITFIQEQRSPADQARNARYLRKHLAGENPLVNPVAIRHTSMESEELIQAAGSSRWTGGDIANEAVARDFKDRRAAFLDFLDKKIADAERAATDGRDPGMFPPARGQKIEIPNSMTALGWVLGAASDSPRLGKLVQHTMDVVVRGMEANKEADEKALKSFAS